MNKFSNSAKKTQIWQNEFFFELDNNHQLQNHDEFFNLLKSHRFKKIQNPAKLKHYVLIVINNITSLIIDGFFYIIENTLGLLIALIDIRGRKKIGKKILVCRIKNFSLHSGFDSMETYQIDAALIGNGYEVDLFYWDEDSSDPIQDVDYFLWGNAQAPIDKSEEINYQNDIPNDSQMYFEKVAKQNYAYSRIGTDEVDEIQNGGNGITGHDETSENFQESWAIIRIPDFIYGCKDIYAVNYNP